MQSEVMFAGFGGQGILLSGKILAHAALELGFEVVWIPSYGPEMRGGTAYCLVIISDKPIGSPVVRNPLHLVAMNRPSFEKFLPLLKTGGVVVANSSLIPVMGERSDVDAVRVPATDLAIEAGSVRSANIVALAAFVARSRIVDLETLRQCVRTEFQSRTKLIDLNMRAVDLGLRAAEKNEDGV